MPRRPPPRAVGPLRLRVVRGPRADGRHYWRASRYEGGAETTAWTGWATPEEADRAAASLLVGIAAPDRSASTLRDLLEYWIARQEDRADLSPHSVTACRIAARHVARVAGEVRLDRLDRASVEHLRDARLREGAASSTIRQELVAVRAAWRWGRDVGLAPDRDLPQVRAPRPEPRRPRYTPSRGEIARVLARLTPWAAVAVRLYAATGCRLGELEDLRWAQLDLDAGTLRVARGKTGRREVPLSPPVVAALRAWAAERPGRPDAPVWPVTPSSIRTGLRQAIHRACAAEGLPGWSAQGLRRAVVDAIYSSGGDISAGAAVLGHSPTTAIRAYREVSARDRRALVQAARLGYLDEGSVVELPQRRERPVR